MQKLNPDWVTRGLIDYEYKKYLLLAYLKWVSANFNQQKLYPFLSDLIIHYNNLVALRDNKRIAKNSFPKRLTKMDFEDFRMKYEKMVSDDSFMEEIESILEFAIPRISSQLKDGREIYDMVEEKINIEPIGIIPINRELGYMFLKSGGQKQTRIYEYEITIFENVSEKYRGIKTSFISTYTNSLIFTFEKMKLDLIEKFKSLPNPAAFLVDCELAFPIEETLLPIAKRSLVRYLASE